jgi:hypothetical protein
MFALQIFGSEYLFFLSRCRLKFTNSAKKELLISPTRRRFRRNFGTKVRGCYQLLAHLQFSLPYCVIFLEMW